MRSAGFQFNERDAEIVHYVHQLRIATLDHLAALTSRSYKALERRVPKLRDERYLRSLKPRPQKGLYVIGSEGVPVLIEGGYAPADLSNKRLRQNEWRDLTIPHALLVADIHTKLILLSREGRIRLAMWEHDNPRLWDTVETPNNGWLPVRPDAYFVLEHADRPTGKSRSHFFLEADVGTMSHARIVLKVKAYAAYHAQRRHAAKHGVDYFQVAIITRTYERAANLRAELYSAMSRAQRSAYHIVPLEDVKLTSLISHPAV
jgi:Replication-relaxation